MLPDAVAQVSRATRAVPSLTPTPASSAAPGADGDLPQLFAQASAAMRAHDYDKVVFLLERMQADGQLGEYEFQ